MSFYRGEGGSGSGEVSTTPIPVVQGGTGATTASDARTNLGVTATGQDTNYAFRSNNLSDLNSVSSARTNLGLGTIATQNSSDVSITGGSVSGITDLAVADGGTGASTAANARVNLLPSYTGNGNKVLSLNSGATDVEWTTNGAGTVTSVDISVPTGLSVSGNPVTSSGTLAVAYASGYSIPTTSKQSDWDTAYSDRLKWDGGSTGLNATTGRTSLGLGTAATTDATDYAVAAKGVTNGDSHDHSGGDGGQIAYSSLSGTPSLGTISSQNANNVSITGGSISGITDLAVADGGTGASDASTARTNLGLGSIATQDSSNVTITGGSVSGITDLAVADGGTGASTAANARINLLPSYTSNGSKVLALNSGATDVEWVTTGVGTVTSVDMTVPTGLAVSGNPVTSSGTLAVTFASGYSIPTTTKQGEWDTAYTDRLKWDGGSTGLTAATGRTSLELGTIATQNANNVTITGGSVSGITDLAIADGGTGASTESGARTNLGATTVGANVFTLTNPSAVTFIRMNADNTVTARSASELKTDLSLNNVENTALSTWAGSTNITTVGTVSTGTIAGGTY